MSLLEASQSVLRAHEEAAEARKRREAENLMEIRQRAIAAAMGALGAWIDEGLEGAKPGKFQIEIAAVVSDHDGVEVDFRVDDSYLLKVKERGENTRWDGGFAVYLHKDGDAGWTLLSHLRDLARHLGET